MDILFLLKNAEVKILAEIDKLKSLLSIQPIQIMKLHPIWEEVRQKVERMIFLDESFVQLEVVDLASGACRQEVEEWGACRQRLRTCLLETLNSNISKDRLLEACEIFDKYLYLKNKSAIPVLRQSFAAQEREDLGEVYYDLSEEFNAHWQQAATAPGQAEAV